MSEEWLAQVEAVGAMAWCPSARLPELLAVGPDGISTSAIRLLAFDEAAGRLEPLGEMPAGGAVSALAWGASKDALAGGAACAGAPLFAEARQGLSRTDMAGLGALAWGREDAVCVQAVAGAGPLEGAAWGGPATVSLGARATSLQFSPHMSCLLAAGCSDGSLWWIDVESEKTQSSVKGVSTAAPSTGGDVRWNPQVAHVLAMGEAHGGVIWDAREKRESTRFQDPKKRALAGLAWVPATATQLVAAFVDAPLQLWDLRNASFPVQEFPQARGAAGLSFSGSLLLARAPTRSRVWALAGQELTLVNELPAGAPLTAHEWSPAIPGLLAVARGTTTAVCHAEQDFGLAAFELGAEVPEQPSTFVGKPVGGEATPQACVAAGFGGRAVEVRGGTLTVWKRSGGGEGAADLAQALADGDWRAFCARRAATADELDALAWRVLGVRATAQSRNDARLAVCEEMGYKQARLRAAAEALVGPVPGLEEPGALPEVDAASFFDQLAVKKEAAPTAAVDWTQGTPATIRECVVGGAVRCAVELCLREGLPAEALLIASAETARDGGKLFEYARGRVAASRGGFTETVARIARGRFEELVEQGDPAEWRELLCVLSFYAAEGYEALCGALARRVQGAGDAKSAIVAHLCAGEFAACARIWAMYSGERELVERLVLLRQGLGAEGAAPAGLLGPALGYARALADEGQALCAARLVDLLARDAALEPTQRAELATFKDRLFYADPHSLAPHGVRPSSAQSHQAYSVQPSVVVMPTMQPQQAQQGHAPVAQPGMHAGAHAGVHPSQAPTGQSTPYGQPAYPTYQQPISSPFPNAPPPGQRPPPMPASPQGGYRPQPPPLVPNASPAPPPPIHERPQQQRPAPLQQTRPAPMQGGPPPPMGGAPPPRAPPPMAPHSPQGAAMAPPRPPPMAPSMGGGGAPPPMPPPPMGVAPGMPPPPMGGMPGMPPPLMGGAPGMPPPLGGAPGMPPPPMGGPPGMPPPMGGAPGMPPPPMGAAPGAPPPMGAPMQAPRSPMGYPPGSPGAPPPPQSTTAPGVGARSATGGMPVPWPLPTATQARGTNNEATSAGNQAVIDAARAQGYAATAQDVQQVRTLIEARVAALQSAGADAGTLQTVRDGVAPLIALLEQGRISQSCFQQTVNLLQAMQVAAPGQTNPPPPAHPLYLKLTNSEWSNTNKAWILAMKRLI